jgi:hypothetical protein
MGYKCLILYKYKIAMYERKIPLTIDCGFTPDQGSTERQMETRAIKCHFNGH